MYGQIIKGRLRQFTLFYKTTFINLLQYARWETKHNHINNAIQCVRQGGHIRWRDQANGASLGGLAVSIFGLLASHTQLSCLCRLGLGWPTTALRRAHPRSNFECQIWQISHSLTEHCRKWQSTYVDICRHV